MSEKTLENNKRVIQQFMDFIFKFDKKVHSIDSK